MKLSLAVLRQTIPAFSWQGERSGFGWVYVGEHGDETVRVVPYGVLCGPSDDDVATQWRVEKTDGSSEPFGMWAFEAF